MKKKITIQLPIDTSLKAKGKADIRKTIEDEVASQLAQYEKDERECAELIRKSIDSLHAARDGFAKAIKDYRRKMPMRFSAEFRHCATINISQLIAWMEKEMFWAVPKKGKKP